jgi:hypothetical protein
MPIATDTAIDYTNKIIDLTGTTVYDVSVLYSYCKEQFKLSANIDDDFAWTANTSTDFTLKNGWVFRTRGIRRLKNGGIKTTYGANIIEKIEFSVVGTAFDDADIGATVTGTGLAGTETIVDYDNTRKAIWIRTAAATSVGDAVVVTASTGGSGTSTGTSTGSTAGVDDQWSNINTIGDLAASGPTPFIYVYTGDLTTGDFNGSARLNNGWDDDPDKTLTNSDRGVLDVLIRIKDMNTTLGNPAGEVRVYGRQGLDKFADFPIDITAGGRIAVPIAQSNDTEDSLAEKCICLDGRNANDFTVGEIITWTGGNSAEIVSFIEGLASTNGVITYRGATAHLTDGITVTGGSSSSTGVTRGSAGGQLLTYDVETDAILEGEYGAVLTSDNAATAVAVLRGHLTLTETGTGQGYAVCESNHDYGANNDYYEAFTDNDAVTGTGVSITLDFVTTAYQRLASDLDHVQIKLAAWDLTVTSSTGFVIGQNITQVTSGAQGTVLEIPDATSIIVSQNNAIVFNGTNNVDNDDATDPEPCSAATRVSQFNLTLALLSAQPYWGLINCNGATAAEAFHAIKYFQQAGALAANDDPNTLNADSDYTRELTMMKEELGAGGSILQVIQGEEFFRAYTNEDTGVNPTDQSADSRIAVKPGASITTGQGFALLNIASADANNYVLTDLNGVKISPLSSIIITLSNLAAGYHIQVALDDGAGQEDLAQYTSGVGNSAGDTDFVVTGTLPNDTPTGVGSTGVLKVVDVSSVSAENKEMRYRYDSFLASTLTLTTGGTGTAEGASSGNTLVDTAAFGAVEVGDPIRNTTDGSIAWVKEKTDANTIVTTQLEGGSSNDWATSDAWENNTLVVAYVSATDTAYIPYIDRVATGTSETETVTFTANRNVVIRVRDTSILDFDTTSTINSAGMSVGAVQNADSVYA